MAINQLTTANTFGQWLTTTTQLISFTNSLVDQQVFNTNSTIIISGTGTLNVHGTALINTLNSNTINTVSINVSGSGFSANVRDSIWVGNSVFIAGNANVVANLTVGNLTVRGATLQTQVLFGDLQIGGFANVANYINVGAYLNQTSGQTSTLGGRVNLTNTEISLAASGNVTISKNLSVTQNVVVGGNVVANRILANVGNIISFNTVTMNAFSINANTVNVTSNLFAGNLFVTNNITVRNLTVLGPIITDSTSNISPGNVTVLNLVNTRNLIVSGAVFSDLNIQGNVNILTTRNISPGPLGNGHFTISGSNYKGYIAVDSASMRIGHNVSSRSLTLEVDETPVLNANTTQVDITGNLNVSGIISGSAVGLTNVNWLQQVATTTDVEVASDAQPDTWKNGASATVTIPIGIDAIDISVYLEVFIRKLSNDVNATTIKYANGSARFVTSATASGQTTFDGTVAANNLSLVINSDAGFGPGAPELRYRMVRDSTTIFTSDWVQLSVPGSFAFLANMVRDTSPVTGSSSTYTLDFQWRKPSSVPEATSGTISIPSGSFTITGSGTNFQAYLSPRASITIDPTGTPQTFAISEILGPTTLRTQTPATSTYSAKGYVIVDNITIANVNLKGSTLNFTGYRT